MRISIAIGLLLSLLLVSGGLWFQHRQSLPDVCIMICIDDPSTPEFDCLSPCDNWK